MSHAEDSIKFFSVGATAPAREAWVIEIDENSGKFCFRRYVAGLINESYGPVDQQDASVFAAAVIAGRDPPRGLKYRDTPFERSGPEPSPLSAEMDLSPGGSILAISEPRLEVCADDRGYFFRTLPPADSAGTGHPEEASREHAIHCFGRCSLPLSALERGLYVEKVARPPLMQRRADC